MVVVIVVIAVINVVLVGGDEETGFIACFIGVQKVHVPNWI